MDEQYRNNTAKYLAIWYRQFEERCNSLLEELANRDYSRKIIDGKSVFVKQIITEETI